MTAILLIAWFQEINRPQGKDKKAHVKQTNNIKSSLIKIIRLAEYVS